MLSPLFELDQQGVPVVFRLKSAYSKILNRKKK